MGVLGLLEGEEFGFAVVRAVRNAVMFAVETRVPYGIANIFLRDLIFPGGRPKTLQAKVTGIVDGTLRHAWILSRIAIIFKCSEELLRRRGGDVRPQGWHSLVAGGLAGYVVMARDGADRKLKEQINMMIGIRTLWAVAGYARRNGLVPLPHGTAGDGTGWTLFVTAVWAAVMWHWRHENKAHPGEMPAAMARSMDFIYAEGDIPGAAKWLKNSSLLFVALVAGKALAARR